MEPPTIDDTVWEQIAPILPARPVRNVRCAGRRPVCDRACLAGIAYIQRHGLHWQELPRWRGFPSGTTCWRRWREWRRRGQWDAMRPLLDAHGLLEPERP